MTNNNNSSLEVPIQQYFKAEQIESILFIILALGSFYLAWWLNDAHSTWVGAVFPLIGVGAIQFIVGVNNLLRRSKQIKTLSGQLQSSKSQFQTTESHRLREMKRNFLIYHSIELGLIPIGLACTYLFSSHYLYYGFGIALAILAAMMFIFDLAGSWRVGRYLKAVEAM